LPLVFLEFFISFLKKNQIDWQVYQKSVKTIWTGFFGFRGNLPILNRFFNPFSSPGNHPGKGRQQLPRTSLKRGRGWGTRLREPDGASPWTHGGPLSLSVTPRSKNNVPHLVWTAADSIPSHRGVPKSQHDAHHHFVLSEQSLHPTASSFFAFFSFARIQQCHLSSLQRANNHTSRCKSGATI
jgi:hypothetical protein